MAGHIPDICLIVIEAPDDRCPDPEGQGRELTHDPVQVLQYPAVVHMGECPVLAAVQMLEVEDQQIAMPQGRPVLRGVQVEPAAGLDGGMQPLLAGQRHDRGGQGRPDQRFAAGEQHDRSPPPEVL